MSAAAAAPATAPAVAAAPAAGAGSGSGSGGNKKKKNKKKKLAAVGHSAPDGAEPKALVPAGAAGAADADGVAAVPAAALAAAAAAAEPDDGSGYTLHVSEQKGRYLTAAKEFAPGDVILRDTAYAYVSHDPAVCIACGRREHTDAQQHIVTTPADAAGAGADGKAKPKGKGKGKKGKDNKSADAKAADSATAVVAAGAAGDKPADALTAKHTESAGADAHRAQCAKYQRDFASVGLHVLVESLPAIAHASKCDFGRLRLAAKIVAVLAADANAHPNDTARFPTAAQLLALNKPIATDDAKAAPTAAAAAADAKGDAKAGDAKSAAAKSGPNLDALTSDSAWRVFDLHGFDKSIEIAKHRKAAAYVVKSLQPACPAPVRAALTVDVAVRLLDILATNSHGVAAVMGSGVFLRAAMVEHSCVPNAVFSPLHGALTVHALDTIHRNTPISISYSGAYEPCRVRRLELKCVYGFDCHCSLCTRMPDLCRSFQCPFDAECRRAFGTVCPFGDGKAAGSWACLRCRQVLTEPTRQAFERAEALLQDLPPVQRDLNALLSPKQSVFAHWHWLVNDALQRQCELMCHKNQPALAEVLAQRLVLNAERVLLPKHHPEKATAYDLLAQTRVAQHTNDKTERAKLVFVQLYSLLKIIKGANHPLTLLARQNALKPPTFAELLRQQHTH